MKLLKQSNKDQYVDLDSRLRKLESSSTPAQASSGPEAAASTGTGTSAAMTASASTTQAPASPSSSAEPAASADPQAIQQEYNAAFTALRNGKFLQSSRQFQTFIEAHPNSTLAPNAFYWLGESYYTVQNFDVALKTFQKLLQLYPDSEKAPGALLKSGYCQDALHQDDAAVKTLNKVVSRYPGSSVANLAQQRLQDIQLRQAN
jgi:tol-pal system protein YbgF